MPADWTRPLSTIRKAVDVLERVVRENDPSPIYRQQARPRPRHPRGDVFLSLADRQAEAEESYRKALAVVEPLARENPAVSEFRMTESQVLDDLGHLLARTAAEMPRPGSASRRPSRGRKTSRTPITEASALPIATAASASCFARKRRPADALEALQKAVTIGETTPAYRRIPCTNWPAPGRCAAPWSARVRPS